jgi:hypothetical protein
LLCFSYVSSRNLGTKAAETMFVLAPGAADIENTPALFIAYETMLSLSLLLTAYGSPYVFAPGWQPRLNLIYC